MANAFSIQVRGVVQGVGFRPFVYRLARENGLAGWVLNGEDGVEIHLEGSGRAVETFLGNLKTQRPPFALIESIEGTKLLDPVRVLEQPHVDYP